MEKLQKFAVIGLVVIVSLSVFDSNNLGRPLSNRFDRTNETPQSFDSEDIQHNENIPTPTRENTLSDSGSTGILNPADVEQSGFISTGFTNARTDSGFNTNTTLGIDTANNWVASKASADIWNLERRYAVNGTFDDGVPGQYEVENDTPVYYPYGWRVNRTTTNIETTQVAGYNDAGFAIVENRGTPLQGSAVKYEHTAGTKILWEQNITNIPYTQNFTLNFRYRYVRGPIDRPGGEYNIGGNCSLNVFINGSVVWKQILTVVSERDVWIETGDIAINIPSVTDTMEFAIGILIDDKLELNSESDYDQDGSEDGLDNTRYITANLDDIAFTGISPPSFEEVNFRFHAGNETTPVMGSSGNASRTIQKSEYWSTEQLDIAFTSNVSISFSYNVDLLEHRFLNSSWTTSIEKQGVSYSVYPNQSAELILYTYLGSRGDYENFNVTIRYVDDWENETIYDPFLNDVTSDCIVTQGMLVIPTPLLDSLGWWEVTFQSPNYAKSVSSQKHIDDSQWITATEFRPANITRASVELGTETETPVISNPVNLTWHLPNGTIWWSESSTAGIEGSLNSSSLTFGTTNTTAGQWYIKVEWINGSEVAYATTSYSLIHIAILSPEYNIVEADVGQTVTNVLRFQNGYTGEYLMGDDATLVGNWSGDSVQFTPNVVKNWWEGDFDTSVSGGGNFTVLVEASKPFYDAVNCSFYVVAMYATQMETDAPSDIPAETGLNENYTVNVSYSLSNDTGIGGATINVDYSGLTDGLEVYSAIPQSTGEYQVTMTGRQSGTYVVTIEGSKEFHHSQSEDFTLIVDETGTNLIQLNGTGDVVKLGLSYRYVVQYENSSGGGLEGANVTVVDVDPSSGLEIGKTNSLEDGVYSILLTGFSADTYTIVVKANLTNHKTQYKTFSLTVSEIPTSLTASPSSSTIAVDLTQTVNLAFVDENGNGLDSATISVLNLPEGLEVLQIENLSQGNYSVILDPTEVGSYSILLRASLQNYQNSTVGFSLLVEEIPTALVFLENGASASVNYSEPYVLEMIYARTDLNQNITGANVSVTLAQPNGLLFTLEHIGDVYSLSLDTGDIGSWTLNIEVTKENYEAKTREFKLTVQAIQTRITDLTLQEDLLYGHTYSLGYSYLVSSNRSGIEGADVSASGIDDDWIEVFYQGNGLYKINLTPTSLGTHSATFTFSKTGYAAQTSLLEFHVDEVKVGISVLDELTDIAGEEKTLRIHVYEADRGTPVSNATLTYLIFGSKSGLWKQGTFIEEEEGIYSTTFTMPPADNQDYRIEIRFDKPYHVLEQDSGTFEVTPYLSEEALMSRVITTYVLPSSIILAGLLVGYGGYVLYKRKRQEEIIEQNRIKRVFTDVHNLLGVLVLNKDSGIPVYSRIIKEGLDDTVISAFISAITQFKSEFDLAQPYEEWSVTPISDLIRIIATENLICAFIVLREPSDAQKEKMKMFTREVISVWQDVYRETPSEVIDSTTKRQFDKLFDDILDASLLETHKVADQSQLPDELKCLEDGLEGIDADSFDLYKLAQSLVNCGIEERKAFSVVMEALQRDAIVEKDGAAPERYRGS
ncbi:MAG: hypothetical protein KGY80_03830 [Candidatus Thorarchaeota archaeon]|nr:hypothetical protein [Candidatus Thorarchaeota archaeon]